MATPTASEKIYAHSPEASQKVAGFRRQLWPAKLRAAAFSAQCKVENRAKSQDGGQSALVPRLRLA
jgi:hypothetical protein